MGDHKFGYGASGPAERGMEMGSLDMEARSPENTLGINDGSQHLNCQEKVLRKT